MDNKSGRDIRLALRFIKSYKKNTFAIFFSFALTFMLLTAMLVLMHTNHRLDNIQDKTVVTPSDCYIENLSLQQIDQLKNEDGLNHVAVQQEERFIYKRNNQTVFIEKGDGAMNTILSKVIKGRLPEREGEIAAEKWVLLNLGIEPVTDQTVELVNLDTNETDQYVLTGILTDMPGNKKYGVLNLYAALDQRTDAGYSAYLQLKEGVDYNEKMKSLVSKLDIQESQIVICPGRENFQELYRTDAKIICVILVICMVVFYGVYRIAATAREKQYGILRAIGMKRRQLQKLILRELYLIYWGSVPAGIGAGLLVSAFIMKLSGDRDTELYFYNERVRFTLIIPYRILFLCVLLTAVLIGIVGYAVGRKIVQGSITDVISGASLTGKGNRSFFGLRNSGGKLNTLFRMGCKYILRDVKTSSFVVLTICVGVTLFTGLAYRAKMLEIYREDTKEMWYLNGDYAMTMQGFDGVDQGISRKSAEAIDQLEDITSVKTASGLPVRVVDDDGRKRNDAYYDDLNASMMKYNGYDFAGNDGINQVYKSVLYGYNENALKELKKYVIEGDFDPEKIKEDEIILSVLYTDDTKENEYPGHYKEGTPLMQYRAGDEIQIKYRADFQTNSLEYETFSDSDAKYLYKTYKIAAIVSFEYMYDCNRTVYPLLITGDRQIQEIAPESGFQCMYVDGRNGMTLTQQTELEQQLIRICNQNNNVSTRSLLSDIKQNEMFYHKQMVYVYGIAAVAFILVLINMIINLTYRMQTRTREISMLRAIGMSVLMAKKMLLFENMILGVLAAAAAFVLTQPVLRYLYQISDMRAFGHPFRYDYAAFAGVAAAALAICAGLSFKILRAWKTRQIVEGIGTVE